MMNKKISYGKVVLTVPFSNYVDLYRTGKINKHQLNESHNNVVKTVVNYFKQYITVTEYMSINKIVSDNIELYIKYEGTLPYTYSEYEAKLYEYIRSYLLPYISDNVGYPNINMIEVL